MHCRRKGRAIPFAAMVIVLTLAPARMGPPGAARPATAPPAAGSVFRAHLIASPFGTIHAATFRFPQPVGTGVPASPGFHLAAYIADDAALSPSVGDDDLREVQVNRKGKGARLAMRSRPDVNARPATPESASAGRGLRPPPPSAGSPAASRDEKKSGREDAAGGGPADGVQPTALVDGAMIHMVRIYLVTVSPVGMTPVALAPWPVETWDSLPVAPWPAATTGSEPEGASLSANDGPPNQTIAAKGEVTGAGRRPKSPAELLELSGAARAKHEKCLADAIYFEARGEPARGQMAVAQVVINRVFSGYYPDNVCGVVYQSTRRHRRLRCQFSFTCDGIPDRVTEPDAWERARRIARDALDGNFWLNDIGKATHYHARWVYPRWVHEMRRLDRIGVHTFYRPRKWGDGAASPVWGDASAKVEKL